MLAAARRISYDAAVYGRLREMRRLSNPRWAKGAGRRGGSRYLAVFRIRLISQGSPIKKRRVDGT